MTLWFYGSKCPEQYTNQEYQDILPPGVIFELYQVFVCQSYQMFTKISELYQVTKCSISILTLDTLKALLHENPFCFFSHLLTYKNSIIFQDATLTALIPHLSFFKYFAFFNKKAVPIRLKIKTIRHDKKLFQIAIKITAFYN